MTAKAPFFLLILFRSFWDKKIYQEALDWKFKPAFLLLKLAILSIIVISLKLFLTINIKDLFNPQTFYVKEISQYLIGNKPDEEIIIPPKDGELAPVIVSNRELHLNRFFSILHYLPNLQYSEINKVITFETKEPVIIKDPILQTAFMTIDTSSNSLTLNDIPKNNLSPYITIKKNGLYIDNKYYTYNDRNSYIFEYLFNLKENIDFPLLHINDGKVTSLNKETYPLFLKNRKKDMDILIIDLNDKPANYSFKDIKSLAILTQDNLEFINPFNKQVHKVNLKTITSEQVEFFLKEIIKLLTPYMIAIFLLLASLFLIALFLLALFTAWSGSFLSNFFANFMKVKIRDNNFKLAVMATLPVFAVDMVFNMNLLLFILIYCLYLLFALKAVTTEAK